MNDFNAFLFSDSKMLIIKILMDKKSMLTSLYIKGGTKYLSSIVEHNFSKKKKHKSKDIEIEELKK